MAKIYTIINNKGGTGKTTTVLNLGAALRRRKKKVLLLDLDSQGNLTSSFGIENPKLSIGEVLVENTPITEAIIQIDKLDLLPARPDLLDFEVKLVNEPGREFMLQEKLEVLETTYDYILIDCPPSLGIFSINSLVAADRFIVPMQAENFAFIGLDRILQVTDKVRKRMNNKLDLAGILFVKLNPRTKFCQAVVKSIADDARVGTKMFDTFIRQDIALMESAAFHKTVFEYSPKSHGAEDYTHLAKEILKADE
jgi:chromosome segregation ATPase